MKTTLGGFIISAFILAGAFHLQAADSTNVPAAFLESWQTISNRWASVSIENIKQAAETNEVTAQYYLAIKYGNGYGVTKDEVEAFKWMKRSAEQGMARAQRKLGSIFQDGLGVAINLAEAVSWYRKAAEQGDATAQMNLGWMFENGAGVDQDYTEAARLYRLAAEQGDAMAQNNLGWLYKKGWGVPDDQLAAVKWFQKSAEQGEKLGAENLAWMYAQGAYGTNVNGQGAAEQVRSGGIAPNHELAEKWMRQAVDVNTPDGQYKFANLVYSEVDNDGHQDSSRFSAAAEWFRKAAEQGYADAQYQLADMYNTGELGNEQRSNCIPWFLKAAAQGHAAAQAKVGELTVFYPNNELLKSVNNIEILRQSGEKGNLNAQYQLAKRYQFGMGVPKDPAEAFKWMQKAAHNDTASSVIGSAIYNLAVMYEKGEGVTQDMAQAHSLYLVAASPVFFQPQATFRVGQMYENGEGVPQDDHQAAQLYSGAMCTTNSPNRYPNGLIEYMGIGDGSLEALFNLWSQGRGFPGDETNKHGYRAPDFLIKSWKGLIVTAKTEFFAGQIYYQGKLVPQDLVEAAARFRIAVNQNLKEAQKLLDQIELKMSPAQKEAAKTRFETLEKDFEQAKMVEAGQKAGRDSMPWGPGN